MKVDTASRESDPEQSPPETEVSALDRFSLVGMIVLLDQISKIFVRYYLANPDGNTNVLPFLNIVGVINRGAAFSFLASAGGWQNIFFIIVALAVSLWLGYLLLKKDQQVFPVTGIILIMGGAIGNLIDRFYLRGVFDIIDFHIGRWHYPAFNIADSAIFLGVVIIIWQQWRGWKKK